MYIEVTLYIDNLYLTCTTYIPHKESNFYALYELDYDDISQICVSNILTYEKIRKVLIVGDFNARVGTYQHFKDDDDVVVRDQTLHDLRIRILPCDIMLGFSYTCLNAQT